MIRRAPHILAGGAWCLPGGAVEPGETHAEAVVREMREEVGLSIHPVRQLWKCELHDGRLVLHWWLVEPDASGDCTPRPNPAEVAEVRWLTPAEIVALPGLLESNRRFLEHMAEDGGLPVAQNSAIIHDRHRLLQPQPRGPLGGSAVPVE